MLRSIKNKLVGPLETRVKVLEGARVAFDGEIEVLWGLIKDIELERSAHTGRPHCPGCGDEVQRHIDDLDIDSLVPGGLREMIREVLREELDNKKNEQ